MEKGDPVDIVLDIKIWLYYLIEHTQTRIRQNETHKIIWDFEIQTDHLIPTRRSVNKKKERII